MDAATGEEMRCVYDRGRAAAAKATTAMVARRRHGRRSGQRLGATARDTNQVRTKGATRAWRGSEW